MSLIGLLVVASALVTFIVATTLLLYPTYDRGYVGTVALLLLCGATILPVWDHFHVGTKYEVLPTTMMLYFGIAIFLARHFYRFHKYHQGDSGMNWTKASAVIPKKATGKVDMWRLICRVTYLTAVVVTAIYLIGAGAHHG